MAWNPAAPWGARRGCERTCRHRRRRRRRRAARARAWGRRSWAPPRAEGTPRLTQNHITGELLVTFDPNPAIGVFLVVRQRDAPVAAFGAALIDIDAGRVGRG